MALSVIAANRRPAAGYVLRSVCASTLPTLKKLNQSLPMRYSEKFYREILASERCRAKFALEERPSPSGEAKAVGAIVMRRVPDPKSTGASDKLPGALVPPLAAPAPCQVYVMSLAVDEAFRRRGVASMLLEDLYSTGAEMGADAVSLHVQTNNEVAIALYESHGFHIVQKIPDFYQAGIEQPVAYHKHAFLMQRRILIT